MKKIAQKIGTNTIYCGSNIFAGTTDDYHFLIKYDSQSSVYTLSFSIEMDSNITKLTNSIKKEIKDAIVSYNNKNLNIVGSVTNKKYLPEIINPLLEIIGNYLKDNNAKEVCRHCKEAKKTLEILLKHEAITFLASDIHHSRDTFYEDIPKLKKILKKIISDDYVEELLETNGRRVLNNEKIEFREMISLKKNVFGQYK